MEFTGFGGAYDEDATAKVFRTEIDFTPTVIENENMTDFSSKDYQNTTDLSTIIGSMKLEMARPTTELTDAHDSAGKMAQAARLHYDSGEGEAQTYLAHNGIDKTIIQSNRYGLMLRDNTTGKYTLALRGMKPTDSRDILNVSLQTSGANESRAMGQAMIDDVINQGGEMERIVAFSMGGGDGFDLAKANGIDATLLDPAINPRHVWENTTALSKPKSIIEIVRNPENFVSVGTAGRNVSLAPQFEVSVVPTGKSGVLANHELLPNFTRPQEDEATAVARRLARVGAEHAQHTTLVDMKKSMNDGESFTDFYRRLNSRNGQPSGVDVDVDGVQNRLGVRVNKGSPLVQLWKILDGGFNTEETSHLATSESSPYSEPLVYDQQVLDMLKNGDVSGAELKSGEKFNTAVEQMNSNEVFAHPAVTSAFQEHLQNAVHPVGLITGTFASVGGTALMSVVDPSGTFGQDNETGRLENQAAGGAITGVIADIMNQGLAGSSALFSAGVGGVAVSAGVGAVAAEGTRYAVDRALEKAGANSDTKNSVSSLSGGAVGGAATVAAADAITIGAAAMTGAEIGSLGGVVGIAAGAGIGAVFGTMAYAIGKVSQIPKVQKAEHDVAKEAKKVVRFFKRLF